MGALVPEALAPVAADPGHQPGFVGENNELGPGAH